MLWGLVGAMVWSSEIFLVSHLLPSSIRHLPGKRRSSVAFLLACLHLPIAFYLKRRCCGVVLRLKIPALRGFTSARLLFASGRDAIWLVDIYSAKERDANGGYGKMCGCEEVDTV